MEITKKTPENLYWYLKRRIQEEMHHGRNYSKTSGGGNRQKYRLVDFIRNKVDMPATVIGIGI